MEKFEGKVCLITGAGSGIGRAASLAFAKHAAHVIVTDVAIEGGKETVEMIERVGGKAEFIRVNVSKSAEVDQMVEKVVKKYGKLDIAINNAGIGGPWGRLSDITFADWDQLMDINLSGVFYCMKAELTAMAEMKTGVIINVSSIAGLRGLAHSSAYSASKHAVIGLTKSAALEYARANIRINAVCPAFTRSPLFDKMFEIDPSYQEKLLRNIPMRRYGQPDDIADAMVWLASDDASFVTGQCLPLDGGMTAG
ncbi:MAG: glucose 1-dehydrogenase [Bacteroidota bacterium]